MIERTTDEHRLRSALRRAPVVLLTGPRQCGKTTLARVVAQDTATSWFDAEFDPDRARLADPVLALSGLDGLVVIDEAQHVPGLFPMLRVLVDRPDSTVRFLILGSASPDLVGLSSESLAGRVELVELGGLRLSDVGDQDVDRLWLRGALPPAFTAASEADASSWRENYIATFLQRDLGALDIKIPATTMRRAWTMLAHYHGQTWNGAELARALSVSESSARRYLDALTDALVVRQVPPWFANVGKRQVKAPKVYIRDTGLMHQLLRIRDRIELESHPKVGASFEGFAVEQLAAILDPYPLYFWSTYQGAELDLFVELPRRRVGFEIKRTSSPARTRSMHSALNDLELDRLVIVYPGVHRFALHESIVAIPAATLLLAGDSDDLDAIIG